MSADLGALAALLEAFPGSTVEDWPDDDLGAHALRYAAAGWAVFPLRGKAPAIPKADGGAGVLDASDDLATVARWWRAMPRANIGGRVPAGLVVLDVDPRHGGLDSLAALEDRTGPLITRTALSGRGDGGRHHYFRHPGGTLHVTRLRAEVGPGLDLKTSAGYCVLPPSLHPDTGDPYRWAQPLAPVVAMPPALASLLRPAPRTPTRPMVRTGATGEGPADRFSASHAWADVLAGWQLVAGDGEADGSAWRHPSATSKVSATVRHGLLFVYSCNAGLPVTEPGAPAGLTKFRAWAHLRHGGDLAAAARAYLAHEATTLRGAA